MVARCICSSFCCLIFFFSSLSEIRAGMVFNLVDIGGAGVGTQARTGFQKAADFWSSKFNDNIVVNLEIGMANLGPSILGGADSQFVVGAFAGFRAAVLADATSIDDQLYSASLPAGNAFSLYINRTSDNPNGDRSPNPYLDNDASANNSNVRLTRANAKALGLVGANDAGLDATIQFSTNFAFDYNQSDGISPGTYDFVGIAIHEIGHAMGFVSGVDVLDQNSGATGYPEDAFTWVTSLDFTRFSADSQNAGADLDWTADARAKYFSVDGGTTVAVNNAWSLGSVNGDGRQASHWKDGLGRGIMDPTFASGELGIVTSLDLRAFDVIGFNSTVVPEPASFAIFTSGVVLLGLSRRKRK